MCAATAGQRGRRVLLVDHYPKLGEKIRISGGGRCNFTNLHASPANYLSRNPHFCRSALARYTPRHFIALVERHRIAYHEKTLGQLFCDDSATQVIDMLRGRVRRRGRRVAHAVRGARRGARGRAFRVDTAAGPVACRLARRRHGRPHGAEDRRHALRLPPRGAVRARGRAAEARARAPEPRSRRRSRATATSRASRWRRRSRAAARASARASSSRTAACRARRSCRRRPTGRTAPRPTPST